MGNNFLGTDHWGFLRLKVGYGSIISPLDPLYLAFMNSIPPYVFRVAIPWLSKMKTYVLAGEVGRGIGMAKWGKGEARVQWVFLHWNMCYLLDYYICTKTLQRVWSVCNWDSFGHLVVQECLPWFAHKVPSSIQPMLLFSPLHESNA